MFLRNLHDVLYTHIQLLVSVKYALHVSHKLGKCQKKNNQTIM